MPDLHDGDHENLVFLLFPLFIFVICIGAIIAAIFRS